VYFDMVQDLKFYTQQIASMHKRGLYIAAASYTSNMAAATVTQSYIKYILHMNVY